MSWTNSFLSFNKKWTQGIFSLSANWIYARSKHKISPCFFPELIFALKVENLYIFCCFLLISVSYLIAYVSPYNFFETSEKKTLNLLIWFFTVSSKSSVKIFWSISSNSSRYCLIFVSTSSIWEIILSYSPFWRYFSFNSSINFSNSANVSPCATIVAYSLSSSHNVSRHFLSSVILLFSSGNSFEMKRIFSTTILLW